MYYIYRLILLHHPCTPNLYTFTFSLYPQPNTGEVSNMSAACKSSAGSAAEIPKGNANAIGKLGYLTPSCSQVQIRHFAICCQVFCVKETYTSRTRSKRNLTLYILADIAIAIHLKRSCAKA